ncbi:MAG: lysophospholipid acyltransferase family protein [Muribaculaceae bacterium]|nr:lysophospholipid acyltransferase family protein [Muribaculaceae bacterium]
MKYRFLKGIIKAFALQPLWMMYGLSDLASFILYRIVKYRVPVVRKNLAMAFPEKSDKERREIEKKFYRHLCDVFIETAKLAHISDKEMARRVTVKGAEHVNNAIRNGKSVIFMLGHFGNWEWVTYASRYFLPGTISCEIYHPLRDKEFDKVMLDLRQRFGNENIPMSKTYRRLLEINKEGKHFACGFISDQRPFTPVLKHWTDFFGIDTAYVDGGEVIGNRLGAEYVYAEMMPEKRGHYTLTISPLKPLEDRGENPLTRAFLKRLEESIRKNPPSWLWSHNRWKRKRGE